MDALFFVHIHIEKILSNTRKAEILCAFLRFIGGAGDVFKVTKL